MSFENWLSLSEAERKIERQTWQPYPAANDLTAEHNSENASPHNYYSTSLR